MRMIVVMMRMIVMMIADSSDVNSGDNNGVHNKDVDDDKHVDTLKIK